MTIATSPHLGIPVSDIILLATLFNSSPISAVLLRVVGATVVVLISDSGNILVSEIVQKCYELFYFSIHTNLLKMKTYLIQLKGNLVTWAPMPVGWYEEHNCLLKTETSISDTLSDFL